MAKRTTKNPFALVLAVDTVSFQPRSDKAEKRGRPQSHPMVMFDFSPVESLIASLGEDKEKAEKRVRCEAQAVLRGILGLSEKVPCVAHHSEPDVWVFKGIPANEAYRGKNLAVTVSAVTPDPDTMFG